MTKKLISFFLCMLMLFSVVPTSFGLTEEEIKEEKLKRQVYLHAFEGKRDINDTANRRVVYVGEETNIYLSVDDPNKGEYLDSTEQVVKDAVEAEYDLAKARGIANGLEGEELTKYIEYEQAKVRELTRHAEPQFDMQGYTVKIYYDPKYFDIVNTAEPLDYTIPNKLISGDDDDDFGIWDEDDVKDETDEDVNWGPDIQEVKPTPGYLKYSPASGETESGKKWVGATILLMESGFFPETADSIDFWYNLCGLKLKAKQQGYTQVYMEVDTADDRTLELFAKNNNPEDDLSFNHLAINDGVFYITIDDKDKPRPPMTDDDHLPGTYNEPINVKLWHDNSEPCEIYYTLNGDDPREEGAFLYNQGGDGIEDNDDIPVPTKMTILAATKRSDGKWSNVATFVYDFLPHTPYLFNSEEKLVPNIYNEVWSTDGYYVYASDKEIFSENITDGSTVYYTFKEDLSEDFLEELENNSYIGEDPYSQWVKLDPQTKKINAPIREKTIVRMATINMWGISNIAVYHLGIKPDKVKATPDSGLNVGREIALTCDTPNSEIYYTLNGGDPRDFGVLYEGPITLSDDSVIKAVALYENEWGDVSAYWYLYTTGGSGITAFYPSGTYEGSVDVTLMPDDGETAIEISYDNGLTWQDYSGPMTIEKNTEFDARLKKEGSLSDKFVYIIKPKAPEFSPESILPESVQFTSADTVTVFSPEAKYDTNSEYVLWVTTDGTEPTEEDSVGTSITNITITDYTIVKAKVCKITDGVESYSDTVTAVYGVVYGKPSKPLTTLSPGYYVKEIGSEPITTRFKEVPEGTKIYYTVAYHDDFGEDPDPTKVGKGTYLYDPENPHDIEVIDSMLIKAIAIRNIGGKNVQSEIGIFNYLVTPEAPIAAPSATLNRFPLVEVKAVTAESEDGKRTTVNYTLTDSNGNKYPVSFSNDYSEGENPEDFETFYINTENGKAYRDKDMTELLGEPEGGVVPAFTDYVILELSATLDGVTSETVPYIYSNEGASAPLSPPYADKESGTYEESDEPFEVNLKTFYGDDPNVIIEWMYKTPNSDEADADEGVWFDYNDKKPEFVTEDTILFVRTKDANDPTNISSADGYVYNFVPPAPIIEPESGVYVKEDNEKITIKRNGGMSGTDYRLYYYQSNEARWGRTTDAEFSNYVIDTTKTVRAYVENLTTGKVSEVVFENYVVEDKDLSGDAVTIEYPFSKKRISAHLLGKGEYAKGVILTSANGEAIYYNYEYNFTPEAGGGSFESDNIYFDKKNAFVPTERMDNLTITAWIDGDRLATEKVHEIDFIHLGVPGSTLPDDEEYEDGEEYQITSEYKDDPNIYVYYTTNGDDPTKESPSRKCFTGTDMGEVETLDDSVNVKAVYYSACGDKAHCEACAAGEKHMCPDGVYGEVITFKYTVPTVTSSGRGGGGGGGSAPAKRKYTKDIFGYEHPTHIGYIKGYPDGSVRPDGAITREEVTAILYRITNHDYESPFVVTGEVFPDVKSDRWSVKEVEYMSDKEVVLGYPDGEFKPANNLKRSEFSALIYRLTGIEPAKISNPFPDLSDDHWACKEILALAEAGLVEGYEDGTYKADNNITRAEVMTVINKILGRKPLESYVKSLDFNPFNDLYLEKWYYVTVLEATITHDYYLDSADYEHKWENWK